MSRTKDMIDSSYAVSSLGVVPPFVRSPYNYDRAQASADSALVCSDPSKTQQAFAEESDINTIVNKFLKTGELPANFKAPQYGDFTEVNDYQTALNQVIQANDAFMAMPAGLRSRFHNNPQNLLEFLANPDNYQEAVKLGLVTAPDRVEAPSGPAAVLPQPDSAVVDPGPSKA